ncbi:LOW QUALITY PROTEIN: uncharacterized protein [Bombus fervidus]|uniref:LOW QUALITY PROTEIN: uncharacterized protein n=1 Tax=Bombus fervidus TaxID=203811 RepID=UPI003AB8FFFD
MKSMRKIWARISADKEQDARHEKAKKKIQKEEGRNETKHPKDSTVVLTILAVALETQSAIEACPFFFRSMFVQRQLLKFQAVIRHDCAQVLGIFFHYLFRPRRRCTRSNDHSPDEITSRRGWSAYFGVVVRVPTRDTPMNLNKHYGIRSRVVHFHCSCLLPRVL